MSVPPASAWQNVVVAPTMQTPFWIPTRFNIAGGNPRQPPCVTTPSFFVRQKKPYVSVESSPGRGARFILSLPCYPER